MRTAAAYTDDDYIKGVQLGDEVILTALVHTYLQPLTRFAYGYTGNQDTAHDIVQDVFARVWQLGPEWNPQVSVASYLFTAIRHRSLDAMKAQRAADRMRNALTLQFQADVGSRESYSDVALSMAVRREMQQLTERQRTALRLRFEQGLTSPQIASVLGVRPKAVEKLFSRAFALLRARLEHFRTDVARVWRSKWQHILGNGSHDPHGPPFARVNGTLMNIPEFAKAFGCKDTDRMVLPADKRSAIW